MYPKQVHLQGLKLLPFSQVTDLIFWISVQGMFLFLPESRSWLEYLVSPVLLLQNRVSKMYPG